MSPPSVGLKTFGGAYGLLWRCARPFLRRHKRLRRDFDERLVPSSWAPSGPVDVWIQAASGGEAFLARQLLTELGKLASHPLRLLCTSCTRQGLDTLAHASSWIETTFPSLAVTIRPFPLDEPAVMRRALEYAQPRLLVLLETELWPGLMVTCAAQGVPVAIINGRMTEKSLGWYRLLLPLWEKTAPQNILATSEEDAARFAELFGLEGVSVMPNMKFDALSLPETAPFSTDAADGLAKRLLPEPCPVVLLASVREQEEKVLLGSIADLCQRLPEVIIVVAPRHMERIGAWRNSLAEARATGRVLLRTELENSGKAAKAGDIVIWDAFGELRLLYKRAQAVFVGGSLAPLGGQNFLEAVFAGLVPCVGPYGNNFTWIGEDLFLQGLVRRIKTVDALIPALEEQLHAPADRMAVQAKVAAYVAPRQGGSRMAAQSIVKALGSLKESASGRYASDTT